MRFKERQGRHAHAERVDELENPKRERQSDAEAERLVRVARNTAPRVVSLGSEVDECLGNEWRGDLRDVAAGRL